MNTIYVFTENFPAIRGEKSFIWEEILELSKQFNIVIWCRRTIVKGVCNLPEGVVATNYNKNNSNLIKRLLKMMLDADIYSELLNCMKAKKLNFHTMKRILGFYFESTVIEREITRQMDEKVIALYSFWGTPAAYAIARIARKKNVNTAIRLHGFDLYQEREKYGWQPFKKITDANMNHIFFISQQGKTYYLNEYSITENPQKHIVVRLGSMDHGIEQWAESDVLKVVSCSGIVAVKRIELMIDALACCKSKINWTHIGDGEQGQTIKKYANERLANCQNITFLFTGEMNNNDVLDYYKQNSIDILLNTSYSEGLPVSMMEAMSFGIPVIASNVGAVSEIVINGITGFLFDRDASSTEIADVIDKFAMMTYSRKKTMRIDCRQMWENCYQSNKNAEVLYSYLFQGTPEGKW